MIIPCVIHVFGHLLWRRTGAYQKHTTGCAPKLNSDRRVATMTRTGMIIDAPGRRLGESYCMKCGSYAPLK